VLGRLRWEALTRRIRSVRLVFLVASIWCRLLALYPNYGQLPGHEQLLAVCPDAECPWSTVMSPPASQIRCPDHNYPAIEMPERTTRRLTCLGRRACRRLVVFSGYRRATPTFPVCDDPHSGLR